MKSDSPVNLRCSVIGCLTKGNEPNIVLYPFPLEYDLCAQWVSCAGRRSWWPSRGSRGSRVCGRHFPSEPGPLDLPTLDLPPAAHTRRAAHPEPKVCKMKFPESTMVKFAREMMVFPHIFSDDATAREVSTNALERKWKRSDPVREMLAFSKLWFLRRWRKQLVPHLMFSDAVERARATAPPWLLLADEKMDLVKYIMREDHLGSYSDLLGAVASLQGEVLSTAYHITKEQADTIWGLMSSIIRMKLQWLTSVDDELERVPRAAQLSAVEWGASGAAIRDDETADWTVAYSSRSSWVLPQLVSRFDLEKNGSKIGWTNACIEYRNSGGRCPPLLLQRRWQQLKEDTRTAFGSPSTHRPHALHWLVAARWPHVVTEPLPSWKELRAQGLVYDIKDEDLESLPSCPPSQPENISSECKENYKLLLQTLKLPDSTWKTYLDTGQDSGSDDNQLYIDEGQSDIVKSDPKLRELNKTSKNDEQSNPILSTLLQGPTSLDTRYKVVVNPQIKANSLNQSLLLRSTEADALKRLESIDPSKAKTTIMFESDNEDETELYEDKDQIRMLINGIQSKTNSKDVSEMGVQSFKKPKLETDREMGTNKNESYYSENNGEVCSKQIASCTNHLLKDVITVKKEEDSDIDDVMRENETEISGDDCSDVASKNSSENIVVDEKLLMQSLVVLERIESIRTWIPKGRGRWVPARPVKLVNIPKDESDCKTETIQSDSSKLICNIESNLLSNRSDGAPNKVTKVIDTVANAINLVSNSNQSDSESSRRDSKEILRDKSNSVVDIKPKIENHTDVVSRRSKTLSECNQNLSGTSQNLPESKEDLSVTWPQGLSQRTRDLMKICKPMSVSLTRLSSLEHIRKENRAGAKGEVGGCRRPVLLPSRGECSYPLPVAQVRPTRTSPTITNGGVCTREQLDMMIKKEVFQERRVTASTSCCLARHLSTRRHLEKHSERCECCCRWLSRNVPPPLTALLFLRHRLMQALADVVTIVDDEEKTHFTKLFDEIALISSDEDDDETPGKNKKRPMTAKDKADLNRKRKRKRKREKQKEENDDKEGTDDGKEKMDDTVDNKTTDKDYDEWMRQRNDFKKYFTIESVLLNRKSKKTPQIENITEQNEKFKPSLSNEMNVIQNQEKTNDNEPDKKLMSHSLLYLENIVGKKCGPVLVLKNPGQVVTMDVDAIKKEDKSEAVAPLTVENLALHTQMHSKTTTNAFTSVPNANNVPTLPITANKPPVSNTEKKFLVVKSLEQLNKTPIDDISKDINVQKQGISNTNTMAQLIPNNVAMNTLPTVAMPSYINSTNGLPVIQNVTSNNNQVYNILQNNQPAILNTNNLQSYVNVTGQERQPVLTSTSLQNFSNIVYLGQNNSVNKGTQNVYVPIVNENPSKVLLVDQNNFAGDGNVPKMRLVVNNRPNTQTNQTGQNNMASIRPNMPVVIQNRPSNLLPVGQNYGRVDGNSQKPTIMPLVLKNMLHSASNQTPQTVLLRNNSGNMFTLGTSYMTADQKGQQGRLMPLVLQNTAGQSYNPAEIKPNNLSENCKKNLNDSIINVPFLALKANTSNATTAANETKKLRIIKLSNKDKVNDTTDGNCPLRILVLPSASKDDGVTYKNSLDNKFVKRCKNHYKRKKFPKDKRPLTGAERIRAYRLRKKMLAQANESSGTEILSMPSTSN